MVTSIAFAAPNANVRIASAFPSKQHRSAKDGPEFHHPGDFATRYILVLSCILT
jgi:hypothetical protein